MYLPNHLHRLAVGNVAPHGWPVKNEDAPGAAYLATWWPLNEGRGTVVFDRGQIQNMNGAFVNNVTWEAGPHNNMVPRFGGTNGYITCGNAQVLQGGGGWTVLLWMRPADETRGGLFSKSNYGGGGWFDAVNIIYSAGAARDCIAYIDGSNANNSGVSTPDLCAANETCLLGLIMYPDLTCRLFKNGKKLPADGAGTYTVPSVNSYEVRMGFEQFVSANYFNGGIWQPVVIARALTDKEMLSYFDPQTMWQLSRQQDVPRAFGGEIGVVPPGTIVRADAFVAVAASRALRGAAELETEAGLVIRGDQPHPIAAALRVAPASPVPIAAGLQVAPEAAAPVAADLTTRADAELMVDWLLGVAGDGGVALTAGALVRPDGSMPIEAAGQVLVTADAIIPIEASGGVLVTADAIIPIEAAGAVQVEIDGTMPIEASARRGADLGLQIAGRAVVVFDQALAVAARRTARADAGIPVDWLTGVSGDALIPIEADGIRMIEGDVFVVPADRLRFRVTGAPVRFKVPRR